MTVPCAFFTLDNIVFLEYEATALSHDYHTLHYIDPLLIPALHKYKPLLSDPVATI